MFGKPHKFLFLALLITTLFFSQTDRAFALVKDTDADGLTDQAETDVYLTDPTNPDTDGDTISDSDEIFAGTNPINKESHPAQIITDEVTGTVSYAWFIGRASGILAFILLTIVVINGLLMTTRLVFRLLPPAINYEMHRFLSWMALITVIGHFVSFTYDHYFHLTFFEGLVPFVLMRDFSSNLGYDLRWAVGIGTIALYGIVALVVSSELKGRFVSIKKWRTLHYSSFLTYILFLAHGFFAGTDSTTWWMIWLYSLSAILVFGLTGLRIYISVRKKSSPVTTPSTVPNLPTTPPSTAR
ncbi:MAG: ferric reductase-like transmembrane domain-containing protein [Candidatus Moranbacteria bacterium]|nr:ferric reductase-like transmembrane domain-containing protein [Candidatus Moranbacteria bacterium]